MAAIPAVSTHDALTGLPGRALFMDRLHNGLWHSLRSGTPLAVVFLDVDLFRSVNDMYGRQAGDEVLGALANLLQVSIGAGDAIARFGGDEFVLLCHDTDEDAAVALVSDLVQRCALPFGVRDHLHHLTVSAGIAIGDGSSTAESLLQDAESALYRAKERGGARIELFDEELRSKALWNAQMEQALRSALDGNELRLHYQPVMEVTTGSLIGFEALLRWNHPSEGLLGPGEFIHLAERSGLIVPIGSWVIREAARQLAKWGQSLSMSVNISARQLADPGLPATVAAVLDETRVPPDALLLEITESVVMDDVDASLRVLRALRDLGVRLAVDDFGTGYSSLAYLKRLPVSHLKIDRAFIGGLGADADDTVLVASIVRLAHTLGLETVAEGVETAQQLDELAAVGCRYGQGYLWSRPLEPEDAQELIGARPRARRGRPAAAGRAPRLAAQPDDLHTAQALLRATRALLRAHTAGDVVAAVVGLASDLGGTVIAPGAGPVPSHALKLDLSPTPSGPLIVVAAPDSAALLRLHEALPGFLDDARAVLAERSARVRPARRAPSRR